jgi:hypothetical protein
MTALKIVKGRQRSAARVVIYGTEGIGKSTLAAAFPNPLVLDTEDGTKHLDVARVVCDDWRTLTLAVAELAVDAQGYKSVVIDSADWAEKLLIESMLAGSGKKSIEDYGFGKGYTFVYETFLCLLADLDAHQRAGRQIICTAHDCTEKVPNPGGEDWLQYQPRLQSPPKQGKVREKVKEWADHLLYISFDVAVEKGKGTGGGTRTIYPSELPSHLAKSRCIADPIFYEKDSAELWNQLFNKEGK